MHLASWSLAALVAVAALLLTQSTEAAGKGDKTAESRGTSLEDELESSLPQPPQQQPQPQPPQQQPQPQPQQPQQQPQAEEQLRAAKSKPKQPKQHHAVAEAQEKHHSREQQTERQKSEVPSSGHRPSREELREMFHELLESMTEAERKSLTLRLGRESVKRTFSRMRDEVRALPVAASSVRKRAMPHLAISHAKALRMRRSLLLGSMESGMSAARQRRKKRDLVDYSPEEYAQLVALLAADQPGYVEDSEGNIRLADEDSAKDEEEEEGRADETKRRAEDTDRGDADAEERQTAEEATSGGDYRDSEIGGDDGDDIEEGQEGDKSDRPEYGTEDALDTLGAELESSPPLPPPPPPRQSEPSRSGNQEPLTMFLVRVAGEKGLFVPLDQAKAQRLAVDLAGEAAIAEAAKAQAAVEAAASDAAAVITAKAAADVERAHQEAGVAELKRFAEKLARRIPPGY